MATGDKVAVIRCMTALSCISHINISLHSTLEEEGEIRTLVPYSAVEIGHG